MNPRSLYLTRARRSAQQWVATGTPDLVTWEKHPANPIPNEEIHGEKIPQQWRDPYVWKDGDRWLMVLCGQFEGEKFGRVFLYQSENLVDWKYVGVLSQGSTAQGKGWECPNYFKLGDKNVLVVSPYGPVIYAVGDFDGERHLADAWHILDHGVPFYATNTYVDDQGRTIIVGWVKAQGEGWNGCLSLPRLLKLDSQNQLRMRPIPELEKLRKGHQTFERVLDVITESAGTAPLFGEQIEIKANFQLQQAESLGFRLLDDEKEYELIFDYQSHILRFGDQWAQLQFTRNSDRIEFHIFVDRSVIEIFINQREVFTITFYPKLGENHALKISPFINKGVGKFSMDVWKLDAADITGQV
jgi:beta-fructofuranosidase